ncbi:hypothetical protein FQN55_004337 [Onygenales sp. PD_40]|nr:hypothetical protein FQN55_004337 [Onygenales sp. PD_40]
MRWTPMVTCAAAALMGTAHAADSTVYQDPETGLTFSEYRAPHTLTEDVIYRIAAPGSVPANTPYDVVIQIVAPSDIGWAGLAWGGRMPNCPLTVSWANGGNAVVSSRYAASHTMPDVYDGATYKIFTTGTHSDGNTWQYTALCTGCTSWDSTTLDPAGSIRLAYATSQEAPSDPSSPSSSFPAHEVSNYWEHDFAAAANANFDEIVGGLQ